MGQVGDLVQEDCVLDGLSGNSCPHLQVGEQYLYPQYNGMNFPDDKKGKHGMDVSLQGHPVEYQVTGNIELPRPIYDNGQHNWGPEHAPCGITMYKGNSFNQATVFTAYSSPFSVAMKVKSDDLKY